MKKIWPRVLLGLFVALTCAIRAEDQAIPDKDIKVVSFESMSYPSIARFANVQGVVVVRISLSRDGNVTAAQALSGPSMLALVSVDNAKKWRFRPNSENAAILVYQFQLDGICAHNTDSGQLVLHPPNLATVRACAATVETSAQAQP